MSCHAVTAKPARRYRRVFSKPARDKLAKRRIDPCHHWQNRLINDHYFDWEIITMNANVGVLLVIGFPLALLACLWVFGKVSVRPE
jgi:hypothetical protein